MRGNDPEYIQTDTGVWQMNENFDRIRRGYRPREDAHRFYWVLADTIVLFANIKRLFLTLFWRYYKKS